MFKKKFGDDINGETLVRRSEMLSYFQEFASYFNNSDLRGFIEDIESAIEVDEDMVYLSQVAAIIKHASEGFPK